MDSDKWFELYMDNKEAEAIIKQYYKSGLFNQQLGGINEVLIEKSKRPRQSIYSKTNLKAEAIS